MSRFSHALIVIGSVGWTLGCTTAADMRPGEVGRDDGKALVYQHPKGRVFQVARAAVAEVGLDLVEEGPAGDYLIASKQATLACWGIQVGIYVRKLGAESTVARVVSKGAGSCRDYPSDLHRRISLDLGATSRHPRFSAVQGSDPDGGGPDPAHACGTCLEVWNNFGLPTSWRNNISDVGAGDGYSTAANDPADAATYLNFPISMAASEAGKVISVRVTYGADEPAP